MSKQLPVISVISSHLNVTNLSLAILSPQLKVPLQIQQNPDFIEGMRGQIGKVTKNVILPP